MGLHEERRAERVMKACVIVNSLYGAGGIAALGMMLVRLLS